MRFLNSLRKVTTMNDAVSEPWLSIIGIGERGLDGLTNEAKIMITKAEVVIGGKRHLSFLPESKQERISWPHPISALVDKISEFKGRKTCVLATGDPMCFGIGSTLSKAFSVREMIILPSPSALSLTCARMGWQYKDVELITLHGRPLASIEAYLQPLAKLVVLSNDEHSPKEVAHLLQKRGFGNSRITVWEHMDGPLERCLEGIAGSWDEKPGAAFNTIAVEILSSPGTIKRTRTPGLNDDLFMNDGMLTKKEIRAITLSALEPYPGGLLWDIGAGSGSISIEWMRLSARSMAIAIEKNPARASLIIENARQLGVPNLEVINDHAPECLKSLPRPNAIFIGGGITKEALFDQCWNSLQDGGCLVSNVVTVDGEGLILQKQKQFGGSLTKIAISKLDPIGKFRGWRPQMPVTQLKISKNLGESIPNNEK